MAASVLLIHGFMTDDNDFLPLLSPLHELYSEVKNILLPGHGPKANLADFKETAVFDCVMEAYNELAKNSDFIDVIGFSMGGAIASYLAANFKVRKLILLAPANKYLNFQFFINKAKLWFEFYHKRLLKTVSGSERKLIINEIDTVKENDRRAFHMALKRLIPNYTPTTLRTFGRIIKMCNQGITKIECPTLIVYGAIDQLVPQASITYLQKHLKEYVTYLIPDISHLMLSSINYEPVKDTVLDFIKAERII